VGWELELSSWGRTFAVLYANAGGRRTAACRQDWRTEECYERERTRRRAGAGNFSTEVDGLATSVWWFAPAGDVEQM
jgi:hypothetical protein